MYAIAAPGVLVLTVTVTGSMNVPPAGAITGVATAGIDEKLASSERSAMTSKKRPAPLEAFLAA